MEIVIKESLILLGIKGQMQKSDLVEKLEKNDCLPGFEPEVLFEKLQSVQGIQIANDKISYKKLSNRLHLYIEDKSEDKKYLKVMDDIYQIILKDKEGLSYQQIQQKLPKSGKLLELNQISHYCRKLYDLNLVHISCKSHCKQVKARKFCEFLKWKGFENEEEEKNFEQQQNHYKEFNFYQNLWLNLQEPLLESEVRQRMNKCEESKSFSRLIDNLFKVEQDLNQVAERRGKIFMYRYKAKEPIKKWPYVSTNQKVSIRGTLVVNFDTSVLSDLQRLLNQKEYVVEQDNYKIGECLNNVNNSQLDINNDKKQKGQRKIQVSQQKINRFACICNYLHSKKIATVKELKDQIIDSERDENNGIIDTRTIHSLLKTLKTIDFLNIHIIKTVIVQRECERWLISHWSVNESDVIVQQGLLKLGEPQNDKPFKSIQQKQNDYVESQSQIKKKIKTKGNQQQQQPVPIEGEDQLEGDDSDIYQSEENKGEYEKINAQEYKIKQAVGLLLSAIHKINKKVMKKVIKKLKPNYDVRIANEIFQRVNLQESSIGALLGLEQKVYNQQQCSKSFSQLDEWEIDTRQLNPLTYIQYTNLSDQLTPIEYKHNKQFKKNNANYESQKNAAEKLKNYLLRYPNQSLGKLMHIFPNINIYALLKKMLLDNTIEIKILTNKNQDLDQALNQYTIDQIKYRITENYLGYF
ncbi:unnamed protein product (macronuclear) [Paramecium tetraurelia]|uniref:Uncharacterized protein n=1 Tax=Paramecium tetraurelia TaxID=5888 RepID=A0DGW3_PARTE|nr:uncharacterized protein GSPATT00002409001 [Paramecium tetraurelia]CAK82280.1 unnamed protein product [Paramecium tetraurelia]|eukprot:XP_001449677.1 hypothetical protein (macronuclear) [Paramecium tetraurelia strain d4-2]